MSGVKLVQNHLLKKFCHFIHLLFWYFLIRLLIICLQLPSSVSSLETAMFFMFLRLCITQKALQMPFLFFYSYFSTVFLDRLAKGFAYVLLIITQTRVTRTTLIWLDKLKKDCIKNFPQGVSRDMRGRSCLTRKYSTTFVVVTHQNNRYWEVNWSINSTTIKYQTWNRFVTKKGG